MATKLNKASFDKLITEDLAWLDKQENTLEAQHIRAILKDCSDRYYPKCQHPRASWYCDEMGVEHCRDCGKYWD